MRELSVAPEGISGWAERELELAHVVVSLEDVALGDRVGAVLSVYVGSSRLTFLCEL